MPSNVPEGADPHIDGGQIRGKVSMGQLRNKNVINKIVDHVISLIPFPVKAFSIKQISKRAHYLFFQNYIFQ